MSAERKILKPVDDADVEASGLEIKKNLTKKQEDYKKEICLQEEKIKAHVTQLHEKKPAGNLNSTISGNTGSKRDSNNFSKTGPKV